MTDKMLKMYSLEAIHEALQDVSLDALLLTICRITKDNNRHTLITNRALKIAYTPDPRTSRKPLTSVAELALLSDLDLRNYPGITGNYILEHINEALIELIELTKNTNPVIK